MVQCMQSRILKPSSTPLCHHSQQTATSLKAPRDPKPYSFIALGLSACCNCSTDNELQNHAAVASDGLAADHMQGFCPTSYPCTPVSESRIRNPPGTAAIHMGPCRRGVGMLQLTITHSKPRFDKPLVHKVLKQHCVSCSRGGFGGHASSYSTT